MRDVRPNILHCHDWQSAPVAWGERPNNAKAVFTIHNLNYGADLVGRAMAASEVATTVSPTYAREVGGGWGGGVTLASSSPAAAAVPVVGMLRGVIIHQQCWC